MKGLVRLVAPLIEPVTLAEAKAHLRVDTSAEDAYITALITAAREAVESQTGRALITQSFRRVLDRFPTDPLAPYVELPRPPFRQAIALRVYDAAGASAVWEASNYAIDAAPHRARLYRKAGMLWPVVGRTIAGIEIDYEAGYGATASDVPQALRQAVLVTLASLFENREPVETGRALDALLGPYRVVRL